MNSREQRTWRSGKRSSQRRLSHPGAGRSQQTAHRKHEEGHRSGNAGVESSHTNDRWTQYTATKCHDKYRHVQRSRKPQRHIPYNTVYLQLRILQAAAYLVDLERPVETQRQDSSDSPRRDSDWRSEGRPFPKISSLSKLHRYTIIQNGGLEVENDRLNIPALHIFSMSLGRLLTMFHCLVLDYCKLWDFPCNFTRCSRCRLLQNSFSYGHSECF